MKNSINEFKLKIKKIYQIVLNLVSKSEEHSISAHAAQSTLFIFISLFPFAMMLLSLLNYVPINFTGTGSVTSNLFPESVSNYIYKLLNEIKILSSGTLISLTALTALWVASKGLYAIGKGLNSVYGVKETRNYFTLRFFALLETIAFIIIILIVLLILVFGNLINTWLKGFSPFLSGILEWIINLRGIGGLLILSLFFTAIYTFMPDRKCRFKSQLPGGIMTSIGWIAFSYMFSFYIDNFSNYSNLYGSLTAVVIFLLWLYFCMYMLFLGGEINCLINNSTHEVQFSKYHHNK